MDEVSIVTQEDQQEVLWERLPDEPANAYTAFKVYLEMGVKRTQIAVAEATGASKNGVNNWAKRWDWERRVGAYDAAMLQARFRQDTKILRTYQEQVVTTALEDYMLMRRRWREIMEQDGEALTPNQLQMMVSARASMDSLARRAVQLPNIYKEPQKQDEIPNNRDVDWVGDADEG